VLKKISKKSIDKKLLLIVLILIFLGLVAIADVSSPLAEKQFGDRFYFFKQQIVWTVIGFVLMFVVSKINYKHYEKYATYLFLVSVGLLIVVLFPQVGSKLLGARRWIIYGPVSIQPSELAKLALVIYLPKVISKGKSILLPFLFIAFISLLVMLQPDLGTTLIIVVIGLSQIFLSGINIIYLTFFSILGSILVFVSIITSDYRMQRLTSFIDNFLNPESSYHIKQVLLAIGSGGIFGVGLGQSKQKFLFVPESSSDSIFAIISEEVGFLGSIIIIMLFLYLLIRCAKIVLSTKDKYGKLLGAGIMVWVGIQFLFNIASMVALVPITGIPLPFFSHGGSALISILMAIGILLNISKYNGNKDD
jgi:cell division protein FtsW